MCEHTCLELGIHADNVLPSLTAFSPFPRVYFCSGARRHFVQGNTYYTDQDLER